MRPLHGDVVLQQVLEHQAGQRQRAARVQRGDLVHDAFRLRHRRRALLLWGS